MEKIKLMIDYESRTGLKSVRIVGDHWCSDEAHTEAYVDDLEERITETQAKASAYDRLMGGKGCVYCNGPESLISDSHIEVEISDGKIHASEDEFGSGGWVKIEYCPMCGRHITLPDGWESTNG